MADGRFLQDDPRLPRCDDPQDRLGRQPLKDGVIPLVDCPAELGLPLALVDLGVPELLPGGGHQLLLVLLGDPRPEGRDRPVARVLADVVEGYVSAEAAARDYGVVVRCTAAPGSLVVLPEDWAVDEAATAALRAERGDAPTTSAMVDSTPTPRDR